MSEPSQGMEHPGPATQDAVIPAESKPTEDFAGTVKTPQAGVLALETPALTHSEPTRVEWLGQTWVLRRHHGSTGADTDEYYIDGEGPGDWSQVLAVQRARAGRPGALAARLGTQPGVQCRVLRQDEGSCVLSLVEEGQDGKEGVMLVQQAGPPGGALVVISYLQRSSRLEASRAALQLGAWRERLLAQAHRKPAREAEETPARS